MAEPQAVESRVLLKRLRDSLAEIGEGQGRLDRVTELVAEGLIAEVCSIYLRRDDDTLELSATTGLNPQAVHTTKMRVREGLVGRIASTAEAVSTSDAPSARGFRYFPETGEEIFASFLGVPIQRLGEVQGVLVIQNRDAREYTEDETYALEVVAMVLAEMAELGAFTGTGPTDIPAPHKLPFLARGLVGQEGVAAGVVLTHDPQIVVSNPVADDPTEELQRLHEALEAVRQDIDAMIASDDVEDGGEHHDVLNAWRMFADDKGWVRRLEGSIESGLAAVVAVEKEQSATRTRMNRVQDPYLRERLHDLDDLSNRLLRKLTGYEGVAMGDFPENAVLIASNIGPGELMAIA